MRERILTAAFEAFHGRGYAATSTRAIFTDILNFAREFSPSKAARGIDDCESDPSHGSAASTRGAGRGSAGGQLEPYKCGRPVERRSAAGVMRPR